MPFSFRSVTIPKKKYSIKIHIFFFLFLRVKNQHQNDDTSEYNFLIFEQVRIRFEFSYFEGGVRFDVKMMSLPKKYKMFQTVLVELS